MFKHGNLLKYAAIFLKLAINLAALTRRIKHPIVKLDKEGEYTLGALDMETSPTEMYMVAAATMLPNDAPLNPRHEGQGWDSKVGMLWARESNPMAAIYIMGAALYATGRVVADSDVSPAAEPVIKRYWEKYNSKPELVVPEVLDVTDLNKDKPWLRAGYLSPGTGDANYRAAMEVGAQIVEQLKASGHYQALVDAENQLWEYEFMTRSGWEEEQAPEEKPIEQEQDEPAA
jgi:hypothetical protein